MIPLACRSPQVVARLALALLAVVQLVAINRASADADDISTPRVLDANLELSLLASEPEIVTPTGLAADQQGRLYVVESHTHSRGAGYDGPASDRVVVFEDTDSDGLLDASRVYADGLRNALATAFSRDGRLYAVQMKSVVALRDTNNDGRCDARDEVLSIETDNNNHHGVLLGLAFDDQNRLYVSLGNIGGSAYEFQAADGGRLAGQGDTGLIVRCAADGSSLERFAHGFWNPPELKFDTAGRLLATDNDPDARGPNRVLHVIAGGEYGYKSRFGGSGLHPYCAWNGELPGTLPMLAGVGEAPVGLLDCATSSLPADYAHDLLVGVWGANEVVRVRTRRRGVSLAGDVEPLIVGGRDFRPTSITATADGAVYIADWADRRYPVHGKGRIWRLAAKAGVQRLRPQPPFSAARNSQGQLTLNEIFEVQAPEAFERLVAIATSTDPFSASAAIDALGRTAYRERVLKLLDDPLPPRRLTGLLALRKAKVEINPEQLARLLADRDAAIRKLTMIWLGETMRMELSAELKSSLPLQTQQADLFETFLATAQLLTAREQRRLREQTPGGRIDRSVDQSLVHSVLTDDRQPPHAKAMALRYLTNVDQAGVVTILTNLTASPDDRLAAEAVRSLAGANSDEVARLLAAIAGDADRAAALRCDAIMSCAALDDFRAEALLPLIRDAHPEVALAAARALSRHVQQPSVERAFSEILVKDPPPSAPSPVVEQLRFALQIAHADRPQTDDQWRQALAAPGDAAAGRRVFFDRRVNCSQCHNVHGRGGRIGPSLSNIAASKTRSQIIASILNPSLEKSPDYQGYVVVMRDGRVFKGAQFHFRGESAELWRDDGSHVRFALSDTEEYRPLDESLMPERLEEAMSAAEFRDLLAFLTSLRGAVE